VTGRDVRVVYTKYDGSLHWHQTSRYLGQDEHGIWLGNTPGSTTQRGFEPPIVIEQAVALLIPRDQWWTAVFNGGEVRTAIYCDIATPARWNGQDEVTMADLDLDVVRMRADHQVLLLDEDEFAEHQVRYCYPAEVVSQAEQAAAWLQAAIRAAQEPFGTAFLPWLEQVS
jgi:uncharacterized protein